MFKISTDSVKNRLYLTISGYISTEEAKQIKTRIETETEKLTDGFDVVNDISNFRLGHDDAGVLMGNVFNYFKTKKVMYVIRVIGSSQSGLIQFAKHSQDFEAPPEIKYLPTIAEAEEYLDSVNEKAAKV